MERKIVGIKNMTNKSGKDACIAFVQLEKFDDYSLENCDCFGNPVESLYINGMHLDPNIYLNSIVEAVFDIGFGGKAVCIDVRVIKPSKAIDNK